jgi:hypothetical protein
MDYIFASSVQNVGLRLLTVSYDVSCQWFTNFWSQEKLLPPHLLLAFPNVQAKVPKFHLGSHVESCHAPYSLGYTLGVGRTDGEGVERNWDGLNGQGPSTKEMGPGNRWDTLDDCCGHANWRKIVGLGESLTDFS